MVEGGDVIFNLYRKNSEQYTIIMRQTIDGENVDVDIADTYDEILLQVRTKRDPLAYKIIDLSLTGGGLVISDAGLNLLTWDFQIDAREGQYFFDMTFRVKSSQKWYTLLKGYVNVTNNISE